MSIQMERDHIVDPEGLGIFGIEANRGGGQLGLVCRYGAELAEDLMPIEREERGLRIEAYLAPPSRSRANARGVRMLRELHKRTRLPGIRFSPCMPAVTTFTLQASLARHARWWLAGMSGMAR